MPKGIHGSTASPQQHGLYILRSSYKSNAKRKGLTFELTNAQIDELVQDNCYYCGIEPCARTNFKHISNIKVQKAMEGQTYYANGVDRIDSKLGYFWDNCVPCCSECNTSKSDMELDVWLNLIARIYRHQRNMTSA